MNDLIALTVLSAAIILVFCARWIRRVNAEPSMSEKWVHETRAGKMKVWCLRLPPKELPGLFAWCAMWAGYAVWVAGAVAVIAWMALRWMA